MASARKLSIALTADLHALLKDAVATGRYSSVSEVVREALRDWRALRPLHTSESRPVIAGAAPEMLVERIRPLCERFRPRRFWVFGAGNREFAVEFGAGTAAELYGQWVRLQLELQLQIRPDATLVDISTLTDPEFIRQFERSRRLLFSAPV